MYKVWFVEQMHRTRGSHIPGTSQDEDGILDPPPVPTNLADAITEEEEDPKELVMINESDDEGGNNSRMDTEPEV